MKPNTGVGSANKPKSVTVKTTHKSPIKGKSANYAIFHISRGRKGKV